MFRKLALFILIVVGSFLSMACPPQQSEAPKKRKLLSKNKLLKIPAEKLYPKVNPISGATKSIALNSVDEIQLKLRFRKNKEQRYTFHREKQQWWVIRWLQNDLGETHLFSGQHIQELLRAFQDLEVVSKSHFRSELSPAQFFFFAPQRRFLMRAMKTPKETGLGAIYKGEWLIYYQGQLFQQKAKGAIYRALMGLKRDLRKGRYKRDWVRLPLNSNSLNFNVALAIGRELAQKRLKLRRCFKKRQFPRNIGPLKMHLSFASTGKIKRLSIETKPHRKHKLVWCVWWFVKQWKIEPHGVTSVDYRLSLPPTGP